MVTAASPNGLYNPQDERSSCGVGFLTRKDGQQTHELLQLGHQALCSVPHRGGMSSEGVGDGAGINVDLSETFFSDLCGKELRIGEFGVGNFFLPNAPEHHANADAIVQAALARHELEVLCVRDVPVCDDQIPMRAVVKQLPIRQWVFAKPKDVQRSEFDLLIHHALIEIEAVAYTENSLAGMYPISLSSRTQVYKGRLNSNEIIPYFKDLNDPRHKIHTLFFHTRFSTNTDPHPTMAQPFRMMAHNGELNTDKKNRLSETAVAAAKNHKIVRPTGQSDSCRLDQTLQSRVIGDELDLVTAVVSMMPPAWENDTTVPDNVRDMLAYFSLYEEKNDGPAALIFGNGDIIGARLDRLGLRPLRSVETDEYLAVMSEAGQIAFPSKQVISRGRIEAGGMLYYDHREGRVFDTDAALEKLAMEKDYSALLKAAQVEINDLPDSIIDPKVAAKRYDGDFPMPARLVAYSHNQESFRFLMDPMLANGAEKVSAMGYGNAINALSDNEGGVAKYFSQRFAQVTNPPLDSIREADGMTLRVAIGAKPHGQATGSKQIIVSSPILRMSDVLKIRSQDFAPVRSFEMLYEPVFNDHEANEKALVSSIDAICDDVETYVRNNGVIVVLSD
ncbi:MAG: glutamate synthase central domain-containing protein, partial [Pseudomonadota bacterium]